MDWLTPARRRRALKVMADTSGPISGRAATWYRWQNAELTDRGRRRTAMASSRTGEVKVHFDAPPERVWSVLADIEKMGEWSPECYRVQMLGGASSPASVGARFKGWNKSGLLRWSMQCEVKAADPGREYTFATVRKGREVTRWRYMLQPSNGGTDVTESFEAVWWPLDVRFFEDIVMRGRDRQREKGMRATLERIKAVVQAQR